MSLTDHVKGRVRFLFYRDGYFLYRTDSGLEFPVPLEDIQGQKLTLLAEDKALYFMRWIRKHVESLEEAKR